MTQCLCFLKVTLFFKDIQRYLVTKRYVWDLLKNNNPDLGMCVLGGDSDGARLTMLLTVDSFLVVTWGFIMHFPMHIQNLP